MSQFKADFLYNVLIMQRTITFIKDISEQFTGKAYLYKIDPPVEYLLNQESSALTSFVVASAPKLPLRDPQIYLFPADESGKLLDWTELMDWKGTGDIDAVMREWAGAPSHKIAVRESL